MNTLQYMINKVCALHKYDSISSHSNLHNKVAIGTELKTVVKND